ncbi:hypothetical protein EOD39_13361 [Acipenser ruthenus]|uniref:Uncharacterized protein n=1 Tax=Acipenser ruthenus TaxID=7906 RepID=A0A662YNJ2_ACIRT|nr:hypothetical protein EOD39_13361 [Acipenser ruthenus]
MCTACPSCYQVAYSEMLVTHHLAMPADEAQILILPVNTNADVHAIYGPKYSRSIQIAEPVGGKPKPSSIVVLCFMEFEATVMGVAEKVKEALASEEPLVLTDVQGNEILRGQEVLFRILFT